MSVNPLALKVRRKKLGLLMYDARTATHRTIHECADAIGVSDDTWEQYENGTLSPSLVEIEILAYYLDISMDHFWGRTSRSESEPSRRFPNLERLIQLRQRMIGAILRQTRIKANLSPQEITTRTGINEKDLRAYELGERPIPLPELEILSSVTGGHLDLFMDQTGTIGTWKAQQQAFGKFKELPKELQDFVCKPVNRPYLELALRLSDLSVEKLRSVAEGLLEITF
jgi:transcriptional regulator with XRE-family HTH domain